MYGDNWLIPDDSPFDWNGWGVRVHPVEENAPAAPRVADWRKDVETILEISVSNPVGDSDQM